MINEQLTPREWQILSAYLDGQLGQRERRVLETRLKSEGILRQGLEELRRTRLLLRSAPRRKAPRNFTISQAMAESYRPARLPAWRAYPAFRLASAVASILLVVTFLGDFALTTSLRQAALSAQTSMEQAVPTEGLLMGAAPQADTTATESQLNAMSQPAGPLPNDTPAPEMLMAVPQPTLNPTEEIIQRMTNAPKGMGGGELATTPTPTLMDASRAMGSGPAATPEAPVESPAPSLKAGAQTAPYLAPPAAAPTATPMLEESTTGDRAGYPPAEENQAFATAEAAPAFDFRNLFRPAEIILAITALLTGLGALILRRR